MLPSPSGAWWSAKLAAFNLLSTEAITGCLSTNAIKNYRINEADQLRAWQWEIQILRHGLVSMPDSWLLLLEYPLIRLGRRLDAVLVTDRAIVVLEFKALKSGFNQQARDQAEDYAFDLRDFHSASRNQIIIPVVVAGAGRPRRPQWELPWPGVTQVYESRPEELCGLLHEILQCIPAGKVEITEWERAPYRPVPTIIEAARNLYSKHSVSEIKTARADTDNLTSTTYAIRQALAEAQEKRCFIIVFVTGIPGAGKTLCGLDLVFSAKTDATFLTGTLPMVYVLRSALGADAVQTSGKSSRTAARETKSKIQSITDFLRHYIAEPEHLPEHVIVFDEAQRAWDAEYGARSKFKLANSEAAIVFDIMERHQDYAVIVALVGNGQEINSGEAGLAEWGRALVTRPNWQVRAATQVLDKTQEPRQRLFPDQPVNMVINDALHLNVAIRNLRTPSAARWVDAILRGSVNEARRVADDELPFFVTRSLPDMRKALRGMARGNRRAGLVCSSGAKRLVADGLWPKFEHMNESLVANWFLKSWPDVRASDALEIPATEFACQALSLIMSGYAGAAI